VLKKYIVALVIALNILLCRFIEDFIQTDTNTTNLMRVATMIMKVKIPKTVKQVCLETDHHKKFVENWSVVDEDAG
jgi:hypothetical protein